MQSLCCRGERDLEKGLQVSPFSMHPDVGRMHRMELKTPDALAGPPTFLIDQMLNFHQGHGREPRGRMLESSSQQTCPEASGHCGGHWKTQSRPRGTHSSSIHLLYETGATWRPGPTARHEVSAQHEGSCLGHSLGRGRGGFKVVGTLGQSLNGIAKLQLCSH